MIVIPEFPTKDEKIAWIIANKKALTAQKKATIKYADAFQAMAFPISEKGEAIKADAIPATATKIKVRSVINTTRLMDTHDDVHIDNLWNKSIADNNDNYLVKEHDFNFDGIITDNVTVSAKIMSWKSLGYNYEGNTQALVYDSMIDKSDSPVMFDKYRTGKVKQHSVGMRYVDFALAANDSNHPAEKAVWDKHYPIIANKEQADAQGYFWAVTQAKNIEGSAVVKGSNHITPTLFVQEKNEPDESTQENNEEPDKSTPNIHKMNLDMPETGYKVGNYNLDLKKL